MLTSYFRQPHRPSERELRLIDLYARHAGHVIERQRAQTALRLSEAYLSMGQRLSQVGSVNWNVVSGEVVWTNETYRIYGFEPGSVTPSLRLFFDVVVHPQDRPALEDAISQVVHDRSKYDRNFRIIRPDGTIRYIHMVGETICSNSGSLVELISTVMDITDRKLAEDALYKAESELRQITRATTMRELAASIAHEVNQPIAAIVSNGEACLRWINRPEPDWNEAQAAIHRMISEGHRASQVISRVRSLVKRAPVRMCKLNFNELIGEVLVLLQRELLSRSVSVRTQLSSDLPSVIGDRVLLHQMLFNLLTNAIEATIARDGLRLIGIYTEPHSADRIAVAIRDSGIGIDAENIEQLFEPFFSNKADGMGMGLWISRSIAEAHGGALWATRNEDEGATFHLTLRIDQGQLLDREVDA
jgi:PAS domain S-box-containing protein